MEATGDVVQSSGTTIEHVSSTPKRAQIMTVSLQLSSMTEAENTASGEEQPLESHEVIELQSFSERKAWIEEKIKFLEQMLPIEVFAGLDAVRSSAEHIPELPTQEELNSWIMEHDTIEKETEIFDRGELTKLRQLTKAATQRNLSPADTDVIELTLTTIYALDKLLHLLRDRSESLELLGTRLFWEENRIAAWGDRRKILDDLQIFLESRARWSSSVYEIIPKVDEVHDVKRRSSVTSLASTSSDTSGAPTGFSRSVRFKLAELLSRDAAQFAARVTGLRHGKISTAGKILDKLIENSRKPVPEELLDEQDKLEEKGITDMEHLGKFVMNMVMQWRKADEIYVETVKDRTTAQNLLEEIETANLHHPNSRQSTSFMSRADALMKRLALRGNPASPTSMFPCPEHPLFIGQKDSNRTLIQILSKELVSAADAARTVDAAAKAYHRAYEAVQRVESLTASAQELSTTYTNIITRMREGVSADEGDGSPPDLASELSLVPSHHSVFLALLPSLLQEAAQTSERSNQILSRSLPAMLNLNYPGIGAEFKTTATTYFARLESLQDIARVACDDVQAKSIKLREARRINALIDKWFIQLEGVRQKIADTMKVVRWRRISGPSDNNLVEDGSSPGPLQDRALPIDFKTEILQFGSQVAQEIEAPLASLSQDLQDNMRQHLSQRCSELRQYMDGVMKMLDLLESIRRQTHVVETVRKEFDDIRLHIEHVRTGVESYTDEVSNGQLVNGNILETVTGSHQDLQAIRTEVLKFVDGLPDRILFVSQPSTSFSTSSIGRKRLPSTEVKFGHPTSSLELPFDLEALNDAVRNDCNSFAITLRGQMEVVTQKLAHLDLASLAKDFDVALATADIQINVLNQDLMVHKSALSDISSRDDDTIRPLQTLLQDAAKTSHNGSMDFEHRFLSVQEVAEKMSIVAETQDSPVREALYVSRHSAMKDTWSRYQKWEADMSALMDTLSLEQNTVLARQQNLRIEEERRFQKQKEQLAAEEQERIRVEQERFERKERERLEEVQRAESLRLQAEKANIAFEEAERARLDHERKEAEARQRLEEIRLADEKRTQLLKDRIAEEEAENSRLQQERMAVEEKLQSVEQELAEQRRIQAEKDRAIFEKLEKDRIQRLRDEERRLHAETERIAAEQAERRKLELQLDEEQRRRDTVDAAEPQRSIDNLDFRAKDNAIHGVQQDAEATLRRRSSDEKRRQKEDSSADQRRKRAGTTQSYLESRLTNEEDVFTLSAPGEGASKTKEVTDLQAQILAFRKRLQSMSIHEIARPRNASTDLPSLDQLRRMTREFSSIVSGVSLLPQSIPDSSVYVELKSLRVEIEASVELMDRVEKLAHLTDEIQTCDVALSDLLEHIDCYPTPPSGFTFPRQAYRVDASPEEQLNTHLTTTRDTIESMTSKFAGVSKDPRAIAEKGRIIQTWIELEDMVLERLGARKSRPSSVISSRPTSGRNSSASVINKHSSKKSTGYSNLSVSSHKRLHVPSQPTSRRAVSGGSTEDRSRPSSQASTLSSNRAVSSPFSPSIYGSTFASRQRTPSFHNSQSTPIQQTSTPARTRVQTTQHIRSSSPTGSEMSFVSRHTRVRTSSSTSVSNWSRAVKRSITSNMPTSNSKTQKKLAAPRKTYVADPKNKLDVAVGDVINKLPVGINVEGVSETWQDQSGKYWIGNQDPKLCFCRILRSQTVMVRVGGGWSELSKFIKDHFADSFRILGESPPRPGPSDEKWISSATLLEASVEVDSSPAPPRTPEPTTPFPPSFALSTPSGQSPHSIKTPSNSPSAKGSPLTPLQFIRRADMDSLLRPVTPTKSSAALHTRNANTQIYSPARTSVWRP